MAVFFSIRHCFFQIHTILHITNLLAKSNVCCKSWIIIRKQIGLVADHSFHQCIICFALRFVVFIMIVKYVCTLICFIKIAADYAFYLIHYISTVSLYVHRIYHVQLLYFASNLPFSTPNWNITYWGWGQHFGCPQ